MQNTIMRRNGTASASYGSGISYKPDMMRRHVREERIGQLRRALAECEAMLKRIMRKRNPNMRSLLKWTDKRARVLTEIKRYERAG